jgi:hypothetical protein
LRSAPRCMRQRFARMLRVRRRASAQTGTGNGTATAPKVAALISRKRRREISSISSPWTSACPAAPCCSGSRSACLIPLCVSFIARPNDCTLRCIKRWLGSLHFIVIHIDIVFLRLAREVLWGGVASKTMLVYVYPRAVSDLHAMDVGRPSGPSRPGETGAGTCGADSCSNFRGAGRVDCRSAVLERFLECSDPHRGSPFPISPFLAWCPTAQIAFA